MGGQLELGVVALETEAQGHAGNGFLAKIIYQARAACSPCALDVNVMTRIPSRRK